MKLQKFAQRLLALAASPSVKVAVASSFPRIALLATIVAVGNLLKGDQFNEVIYLTSVASTLQLFLDPGLGQLVPLSTVSKDSKERAVVWADGLLLQILASLPIIGGIWVISLVVHAPKPIVLFGLASGGLTALESVARYSRVHYQIEHRFNQFAFVDISLAAGRCIGLVCLVVGATVSSLTIGYLVASIIPIGWVLWIGFTISEKFRPKPRRVLRLLREVAPYGAATSFASLYSQGPVVMVGLTGHIRTAALFGLITRITQPTELVPGAMASVSLPRLALLTGMELKQSARSIVRNAQLVALGMIIITLGGGSGLLIGVHRFGAGSVLALLVLSCSLPLKFGNYQYANVLFVLNLAKYRLLLNGIEALTVLGLAALVSPFGAIALAGITLVAEGFDRIAVVRRIRICNWTT